jgi:hypothetical protein
MKNDLEVCPGNESRAPGAESQRVARLIPPDPTQTEIPRSLTTAEFEEMMRQSDEAGDWMLSQLKLRPRKT